MEGKKIENVLLMNVWHIMMERKYIIFMENIHGILSDKMQGLNREEKLMNLYKLWKNLQNGTKKENANRDGGFWQYLSKILKLFIFSLGYIIERI